MLPRWLLWTFLALISWGIWGVLLKMTSGQLNGAHSQLLSTLGMLPILIGLLLWRPTSRNRSRPPNAFRGSMLAFGSGIVSCLGNVTMFGVLEQNGAKAATVIPLTSMAPLVTVILAVPFLGERLSRIQLSGLVLSTLAIYLFNVPVGGSADLLSPWILWAFGTMALWGMAGLLQKMATNDIPGETAMLAFLWAFVLLAGVIMLWQGIPEQVTLKTLGLTFVLGLTLALGNLAVLIAFAQQGKASIISPLCGLYPLISLPLAIWYLGENIGRREWIGILVSLTAVLLMSWEKPETVQATRNPVDEMQSMKPSRPNPVNDNESGNRPKEI